MKNKVLVKIIIPYLITTYEIYIPVNERIVRVKELIIKGVYDLSDQKILLKKSYSLIDPDTGTIYDSRSIVRDTNIVNSKKIILF